MPEHIIEYVEPVADWAEASWRVIDLLGQTVDEYDTLDEARTDFPFAELVGRFAM